MGTLLKNKRVGYIDVSRLRAYFSLQTEGTAGEGVGQDLQSSVTFSRTK